MKRLRSSLAACAFVVLGVFGAPAANAAQFVYLAPCIANCAALGIADGANVAGIFDVDDGAVAPNAVIDQTDMTAAAVFAGTFTFTLADFALLAIALDSTGTSAIGWLMIAQSATGSFAAINDGSTNLFAAGGLDGNVAIGGPAALFRTVPEPATLALLGGGLLLAGWSQRRARR